MSIAILAAPSLLTPSSNVFALVDSESLRSTFNRVCLPACLPARHGPHAGIATAARREVERMLTTN